MYGTLNYADGLQLGARVGHEQGDMWSTFDGANAFNRAGRLGYERR